MCICGCVHIVQQPCTLRYIPSPHTPLTHAHPLTHPSHTPTHTHPLTHTYTCPSLTHTYTCPSLTHIYTCPMPSHIIPSHTPTHAHPSHTPTHAHPSHIIPSHTPTHAPRCPPLRFEDHRALEGGPDGLRVTAEVLDVAQSIVRKGG